MLGLNAVGICSSENIEKQMRYNFLLPNVSLSGARMSGPIPSITTKPVVAPTTSRLLAFKSFAIWSIPGVNMELARGLRIAMRAMMVTLAIFLALDHCLGFSSSSLEKSIV